jgi:hypothetical protein
VTTTTVPSISGLYEVAIGVHGADDGNADAGLLEQISYWESFGFRIGRIGGLRARDAQALYGVDSNLRSVRLHHQDADHGLVRLMAWSKPRNEGLGLAKLLSPGSRWAAILTSDILRIWNHAELAQRAARPTRIVTPHYDEIYKAVRVEPYVGENRGVREMVILHALTRSCFYERFGYVVPRYGRIADGSKFQTSQITHAGVVFQSDDASLPRFYVDVLGLVAHADERFIRYEEMSDSVRALFMLEPGDDSFSNLIDNPLAGRGPQDNVSGRILVRRIPTNVKANDHHELSRPGSLGHSLYSYRVTNIDDYRVKLRASRATNVTEVLANEFGEKSVSFRAPDGYDWTLVS